MGQQFSKEQARLKELRVLASSTHRAIMGIDAADKARAGTPGAPGCDPALRAALYDHYRRLLAEQDAIMDHWRAENDGRNVPMPEPTPHFNWTPRPAPQAGPTTALAVGPDTPTGGTGSHRGERGASSSSKEGAPVSGAEGSSEERALASGAECSSEVVPLLGAGTGKLEPRLRRRHGRPKGG